MYCHPIGLGPKGVHVCSPPCLMVILARCHSLVCLAASEIGDLQEAGAEPRGFARPPFWARHSLTTN